jgi:L-lactate dehydrogenase complex protein LldG
MSSRSHILGRIRKALRTPADKPPAPPPFPPFLPIPEDDIHTRFEREFLALKGEYYVAKDWVEAQQHVKTLVDRYELRRIVTSPEVDLIQATQLVQPKILDGSDCGKKLANVDLGVTLCDCLIARTGSIVLTTQSGFGRALSVLPPSHLVVARRSQLVVDLSDAYQLLYTRHKTWWPSMLTIITGPSRTSDIEKMLVLGAHGPKKLFLLLLDF